MLAKRVAVLAPAGPEGPQRLAAAGAGLVLVVGGNCPPAPGVEVWQGDPNLFPLPLPLRPASVDAVLCIEAYAALGPERRAALIQDARRVLRPGGVLAVWCESLAAHEQELRAGFREVAALAQMRWSGLSLAPVGEPAAGVRLAPDLLPRVPPGGPFLLLGAETDLGPLVAECLIVPLDESLAPGAAEPATAVEIAATPTPVASAPALDDGDLLDALFDAPTRSSAGAPVIAPPVLQIGPNAELALLRDRVTALTAERDQLARDLEQARAAPVVAPAVDEAPRATADAAFDRDRLREELSRRTSDIQALETKLWQAEEDAQRENLENVRLVTDVDRLREQLERSRVVEQERVQELERLGHELRKLEVGHAELQGLHQTREQRLRELEAAAQGDQGPPELASLQEEIRGLGAQRDQAQALERAAAELAKRRERELAEAGRTIRELRRTLEEHAGVAANLRGEIAVIQVRVDQYAASVPKLQDRLREHQKRSAQRDEETSELQKRLEEAVGEQQHLRTKLRLTRQELDELTAARSVAESEQQRLRDELEAKRQSVEQLQQIVALGGEAAGKPGNTDEVAALRALLAQQTSEHAAALARGEELQKLSAEAERERLQRVQLEANIRGEEQEYLLYQLDTAEQRIWEMNDATDRSAARLAAGLAQLDKQKEQYEDLVDQLDVSRNLLAEAQAQVAELERQLQSERTRIARLSLDAGSRLDIDIEDEDEEGASPGTFDLLVEDRDELAPRLRRDPTRPDPLAGIDFDDDNDVGPSLARLVGAHFDEDDDTAGGVHIDVDDGPDERVHIDVDDDEDDDDELEEDVPPAPPPAPPRSLRTAFIDDEDVVDIAPAPAPLPAPPRSLRTAFIDDEDGEDMFTIDTDQIELATPTPAPPVPDRPGFTQKLTEQSSARIVIEVLEDEAWPEDGAGAEAEPDEPPAKP